MQKVAHRSHVTPDTIAGGQVDTLTIPSSTRMGRVKSVPDAFIARSPGE
jgi:hypothetical protein